MKVPKDISNENLLKLIDEHINWTRPSQKRFFFFFLSQFKKRNWISPDQRRVLFEIAVEIISKKNRLGNFAIFKSYQLRKVRGLKPGK